MYWFAQKACSAVTCILIRQCMKRLKNWWLNASEIPLVAIPYIFPPFLHTFLHVSPIISPVSLGISHISRCFSLFLFVGLTFVNYLVKNSRETTELLLLYFTPSLKKHEKYVLLLKYWSDRNNGKLTFCLEILSKITTTISISTINPLKLT